VDGGKLTAGCVAQDNRHGSKPVVQLQDIKRSCILYSRISYQPVSPKDSTAGLDEEAEYDGDDRGHQHLLPAFCIGPLLAPLCHQLGDSSRKLLYQ